MDQSWYESYSVHFYADNIKDNFSMGFSNIFQSPEHFEQQVLKIYNEQRFEGTFLSA
jgi:hypothetical protein